MFFLKGGGEGGSETKVISHVSWDGGDKVYLVRGLFCVSHVGRRGKGVNRQKVNRDSSHLATLC